MAKTVTCEKCGGVQAIFRDENGGMKCAFCGEEIQNLPPYEEGEELSYGTAEVKTEPLGEAAEAVFTLRRGEVEKALILTGRLKPHLTASIVETVLLAVLLAIQGSSVISGLLHIGDAPEPGGMNIFLLVVIIALIPAVWILPRRNNRRIVDSSVSGNELRIRVYENLCEVFIPAEGKGWNFEYATEKYAVSECEEMLLISLGDGRLLALPKRGFAPGAQEVARERLVKGAGEMTPLDEKLVRKAAKVDMNQPEPAGDAPAPEEKAAEEPSHSAQAGDGSISAEPEAEQPPEEAVSQEESTGDNTPDGEKSESPVSPDRG